MGGAIGGNPNSITPAVSSLFLTPNATTANDDVPISSPNEPILLPSTRIELSPMFYRAKLNDVIDSRSLRLELR